ncbi:uncharacterized protein K02A2.6-like [Nilaparvata lugens]|uniref:uncharacterized protein K02A2.6-like n=1 Tax=Nilaparvata lugens TaxID=108931 RepID=UPI00193E236E|nr:uncharacterized protein K02A2.6-like [Nilaparvata lugens]
MGLFSPGAHKETPYQAEYLEKRLYKNLSPLYKLYIREAEVYTIDDLLHLARQYERIKFAEKSAQQSQRAVEQEEVRKQTKPRQETTTTQRRSEQPPEGPLCWQCKKVGHWRSECPEVSLCSKCGKPQPNCSCEREQKKTSDKTTVVKTRLQIQLEPELQDDSRLSATVEIGDRQYSALLDTGAESNYISSEAFNSLEAVEREPVQRGAAMANGVAARLRGGVIINLKVGRISLSTKLTIMDGLSPDILLGMEFLREHRVKIDPYSRSVEWDPYLVKAHIGDNIPTPKVGKGAVNSRLATVNTKPDIWRSRKPPGIIPVKKQEKKKFPQVQED